MRPVRFLFFCSLFATLASCASQPMVDVTAPPTLTTSEVLALEQRWHHAIRSGDRTLLDALFSADFVVTGTDGTFRRKDEEVALWLQPSELREQKLFTYEDVVLKRPGIVILAGLTFTRAGDDGPMLHARRYTAVWLYENERWQLTALHLAAAPGAQ